MGRHISTGSTAEPRHLSFPARAGVTAAAAVVVVGAAALVAPDDVADRLPWAARPPCAAEPVKVVVEPELQTTVQAALAGVGETELPGGGCVSVEVRPQTSALTVASSRILPPDRAPQVWIPATPRWTGELEGWTTREVQPFVVSPVVVTTSRTAAASLGWNDRQPGWGDLLGGRRTLAAPALAERADTVAAFTALWQTLGRGPAADAAIINLLLTTGRGQVPSVGEALAIARSGTVNAPVMPVTEQAVAATNASVETPMLATLYPREGSPLITYPLTRVTAAGETPRRQAAVRAVLARLGSPEALKAARQHGFRGPGGEPPLGREGTAGIDDGPVRVLAPPPPAVVTPLVDRMRQLERPSRILAVLDVSGSMRVKLDDGVPRLALAANSAGVGMGLLPDTTAVGIWVFARQLAGEQDWRELAPVRRLDANDARGRSQRDVLAGVVGTVDDHLSDSGTGLYDTTIAAFRTMHRTYDASANNAIIILTDGADDDPDGTTLDQVVAEIQRLNAGRHKVAIYLAGLGPEADYPAMSRVARASGGWTYRIDSALQGQTALLDGLRRSRDG